MEYPFFIILLFQKYIIFVFVNAIVLIELLLQVKDINISAKN